MATSLFGRRSIAGHSVQSSSSRVCNVAIFPSYENRWHLGLVLCIYNLPLVIGVRCLWYQSMAAITAVKRRQTNRQLINPFYSPSFTDDGNEQYKYAQYKVRCYPPSRVPYTCSLPFSLPFRTFLGSP